MIEQQGHGPVAAREANHISSGFNRSVGGVRCIEPISTPPILQGGDIRRGSVWCMSHLKLFLSRFGSHNNLLLVSHKSLGKS